MVTKSLLAALLLALQAACASLPPGPSAASASPCARSEASMECQIERYNNVNVD